MGDQHMAMAQLDPLITDRASSLDQTLTFDRVSEHTLPQLKVLNGAIFPIKYNDKVYHDILSCGVSMLAYYNNLLVGAVAARLENGPEVRYTYLVLGPTAVPSASVACSRRVRQLLGVLHAEDPAGC
jgi:hypothetical protein